ncbi:MAG TPA: DsbA family protein [Gammaproteobacteria bacterium]|nr:DsbA family protein [Gammaproteobacteria bacterium]
MPAATCDSRLALLARRARSRIAIGLQEAGNISATLHYIHDPLCGWCYAAEPLVKAAAEVPGLALKLHGGGLWPEPTRLPEDMRNYIRDADERAAKLSGQPYGEAYLSGLLLDPTLTLESRPTTAAVLAVESIDPSKGLAMLTGIQHAHWEHGLKVVEREVLRRIAGEIGLDRAAFETALDAVDADAHIASTRRIMQQIGAGGFPAFVLEIDGQWSAVPNRQFASDPRGFASWLGRMLGEHAAA